MGDSSKQAQLRENERLQKAIDEVKIETKALNEKFDNHVHMRANQDQTVALTLQEIKTTSRETLEQATKTNGKVAEHEKKLIEIAPILSSLTAESEKRKAEDARQWRFWWEWGVRLALFILGIVLMKLGIITVPLGG